MTEAYIYDAVRTPRGKGKKNGSLHEITALQLAAEEERRRAVAQRQHKTLLEDLGPDAGPDQS